MAETKRKDKEDKKKAKQIAAQKTKDAEAKKKADAAKMKAKAAKKTEDARLAKEASDKQKALAEMEKRAKNLKFLIKFLI